MKGSNPKTSAGLADDAVPLSVGPENGDVMADEQAVQQDFREPAPHKQTVASLRLLWESRGFLGRVTGAGLLLSALMAFLIPSRYQSVARLMPPDNRSGSGLAMAAAALSGGAAGLGGMAGDLLGLKSTSDLLVGILNSRTVEDTLIQRFDLRKLYGVRRIEDARKDLAARTGVSVDRKSQIITISVTDKSPQRAAAMAQVYVEELNHTLAEVSTSSARRERIFLEGRLQAVNQDLEAAEKEFSQFASKNTAIDIKEQGRAMVEAAATLQGQLIGARSELEGLRQLYADNNVRVRSTQARVDELENQLKKVGGKDDSTSLEKATQGDALYPSIRKLPLLGVPYDDLYRKTKVQEAVFETLTQEYELANTRHQEEAYTSFFYKQAYTNKGFLIGNTVGRRGSAFDVSSTYWLSPRKRVQVGWHEHDVSKHLIPSGGSQNTARVQAGWLIQKDIEFSVLVQHERWVFPFLATGTQSDNVVSLQFTVYPKELWSRSAWRTSD